jgi:phosphohistidine phosphatase
VLLVSHQPLVGSLVGMLEHGHAATGAHEHCQPGGAGRDWPLAGLMTLRVLAFAW